MKKNTSFQALTAVTVKPLGPYLSEKNRRKLPRAVTVTQATRLKSAEELLLSILLHGSN